MRAFFKTVFSKLDKMVHEIQLLEFVSPNILQSANIVYRVKGESEDKEIRIPGFAVFSVREEEDGRLRSVDMQTWLDPSPLLGRIAEVLGEDWASAAG